MQNNVDAVIAALGVALKDADEGVRLAVPAALGKQPSQLSAALSVMLDALDEVDLHLSVLAHGL